jgi:hypothetical protein
LFASEFCGFLATMAIQHSSNCVADRKWSAAKRTLNTFTCVRKVKILLHVGHWLQHKDEQDAEIEAEAEGENSPLST